MTRGPSSLSWIPGCCHLNYHVLAIVKFCTMNLRYRAGPTGFASNAAKSPSLKAWKTICQEAVTLFTDQSRTVKMKHHKMCP